MSDVAGTLRGVTLGGIPFNVSADTNISAILTGWEVSRIPHSGGSMKKMVKRVRRVEGITLLLGGNDREILKNLAETTDDITLAFETVGGDNYHATGSVEYENWESEDNKSNVILDAADDWEAFLAA